MRSSALLLALLLSAAWPAPAVAQSPSHRAAAEAMLAAQLEGMFGERAGYVRSGGRDGWELEWYVDGAVAHMSEAEMREATRLFRSPAGKRSFSPDPADSLTSADREALSAFSETAAGKSLVRFWKVDPMTRAGVLGLGMRAAQAWKQRSEIDADARRLGRFSVVELRNNAPHDPYVLSMVNEHEYRRGGALGSYTRAGERVTFTSGPLRGRGAFYLVFKGDVHLVVNRSGAVDEDVVWRWYDDALARRRGKYAPPAGYAWAVPCDRSGSGGSCP